MSYNIPGVFIEPEKNISYDIQLPDQKAAGFIGLAEKGPLHQAVRIKSFSQFKIIFGGFTDYSYLAYAVNGFFSVGGKECIVVRIAHIDENNPENSANKARLSVKNIDGEPAFDIIAQSEGSWGNKIEIKLQHINAFNYMVKKWGTGETAWIQLNPQENTDEYQTGDAVCLRGEHTFLYNTIGSVKQGKIHLTKSITDEFFKQNKKIVCEILRFNLNIIYGSQYEEYLYLSSTPQDPNYFLQQINKASKLVYCENNAAGNTAIAESVNYKNLKNGSDGIVELNPADFIGSYKGLGNNKGLGIFELFDDIDLLAAPDVLIFEDIVYNRFQEARKAIFTVQKAMIEQCERLGNRFTILDVPATDNIQSLIKWAEQFDTGYAALYYPRIEIINPEDSTGLTSLLAPPSGHIAGIYALCDTEEGIHRAPANKFIRGAVGLSTPVLNDEIEILYPRGINCFKYIPGKGIKVWGARTLSSDPAWRYINIRRVFSAIKESLKQGTGWAVFEPNDDRLRKKLVRHITAFLIELWRKGYLAGNSPEEAFFIRCDDELNYPKEIEAGRINVEIGIAIAKPAEYIIIKMRANIEKNNIILDD